MILPSYSTLTRFSDDRMQKVSLFESHRMFADLYCMMPGQEQRPHTHDDSDKIYFVLEGACRASIGEEERELEAGESCVAPAGVPHGVRNESGGRVVLLVFMAPHPSYRG